MKINQNKFRTWLKPVNFAEHGDKLEQKLQEFLRDEFPNIEIFWRNFVVPLTTRLIDYPNPTKPSISYRDEINESLQHICSANYSIFVHLALAKKELKNWNEEQSLESIYLRLSSSFDVFESLCFAFSKLLHECKGTSPTGLEKFDEKRIAEIATDFAKKYYPKSFEKFVTKGQAVTIRLHNLDGVLTQYFSGMALYGKYKNHSSTVRKMRNALVHDLRLGQIADENGKIFIPRPEVVDRYRSWSQILSASKSTEKVKADFSEPINQASSDLAKSLELLNGLYAKLLNDFDAEFYAADRPKLKKHFHIEFGDKEESLKTGQTDDLSNNLNLSVSDSVKFSVASDVAASGVARISKLKDDHPIISPSGTASFFPPRNV